VNRFDIQLADSKERGKIICPHCGLVLSSRSNYVFLTHALSADQEEKFNSTDTGAGQNGLTPGIAP
jgi:hypothetical protein